MSKKSEVAAGRAAKVQEELQQYLDSKNFNVMFTSMVEHLLSTKPEDPVTSVIEYMFDKYPESARRAKISLTREERPRSRGRSGRQHSEEEEYSEEEEEDGFGMPSPGAIGKLYRRGKRGAVSSESIDPAKMKEQMLELPTVHKTPEVLDRLRNLITSSKILSCLDDDAKEMLIKVFSGPVEFQAGQTIIQQGEEGDHFYLIDDGVVDVFVKKEDEEEESKILSYNSGESFGELAMMYNAPRAATCKANTDCKLWTLDRKSFKVIVVGATIAKREKYVQFLSTVPILSTLTDLERTLLADSLVEESFPEGSNICSEGELGNYFYIIAKGNAMCLKKPISEAEGAEGGDDSDAVEVEVGQLSEGNYFGEVALLTQKPRQATVRAVGPLDVLSLDRATFVRLLGSIDDILRRNMDEYNKRLAQEI